ncbi:phage tail sheath family protein [Litchfieldella rifensis]|uniref:Phage tail sheath family protein n=1 Tax=Litchfieldella rifensis TaxID=762643 RepID=A0ABV7LPB7_9GAMM
MPSSLTYPGVYIEEIPSGVRTITGVSTSITAFVGRALRGPVNTTVRVQSFAEYSRLFGGLWQPSTMSHAVNQFFQHGGSDALIVRVFNGDIAASTATVTLPTDSSNLVLEAASPGVWGSALRATVDHETRDTGDDLLFNLLIEELDRPGGTTVVGSEQFRNVSVDPLSPRFVDTILNEQSALVSVRTSAPTDESPTDGTIAVANPDGTATTNGTLGSNGSDIADAQITGDRDARTGLFALEAADLFNLLCIPPLTPTTDLLDATWAAAASYCQERRAVLIVDAPAAWTANPDTAIGDAETGVNGLRATIGNDDAINAMVYFPRLRMPDPLRENRLADFAPCGAVAGIIARTDGQRGVWKAPAGLAASFSGIQGFTYTMTDRQNGVLNPVGLNCLRSFPVAGHLVWGSRTLAGADLLASEWKYIPVRRLALFIEESLFRGTQWVVFEPNDEPLWAQIRLNIGAFMQNLFRQGAFQGTTPRNAYFVKCDSETTTQNDIDRGIVNILVGFAPLKPAEFVVIKIQQMAGQVEV